MKYICCIVLSILAFSCKQPQTPGFETAKKLENKVRYFAKEKNHDSLVYYGEKAVLQFKELRDSLSVATTLFFLTRTNAFNENFELARDYGYQARKYYPGFDSTELKFRINNMIAWSNAMTQQDLATRFEIVEEQLRLAEETENFSDKALAYNNYAYDGMVGSMIHLDSALHYANRSNEMYAFRDKSKGLWYTLMNLSWIFRLKNEMDPAGLTAFSAYEGAIALNDRHALIETGAQMGQHYLETGHLAHADTVFTAIAEIANAQTDRDKFVFDIYYAQFLWEKGEKEKALSLLNKSVEALNNREAIYEMLGRAYLAHFLFESGRKAEALQQLAKFKKPHSDYFTLEAKTIAAIVMDKLNFKKPPYLELDTLATVAENTGARMISEMISNHRKS